MMKSRGAPVIGAFLLIALAIFVRGLLVDDGGGGSDGSKRSDGGDAPVVACTPELMGVCEALANEGMIADDPMELDLPDAAEPPPDCDPGNDGATELGQITCGAPSWGPTCMELCATSGVARPAWVTHTVTTRQVLLYNCCAGNVHQECCRVDPYDC